MEASGSQIVRAFAGPLLGVMLALGVPAHVGVDSSAGLDWSRAAPPPELLDGDLVFRRGVDTIGRIVLSQSEQSRFSHVGMVIRVADEPLVVHALPETRGNDGGVQVDRLGTFSSPLRAADIGYYRIAQLTQGQRREIHRYLLEHVGTPFDLRFEYSTDNSMYCTELVLKALNEVGVELAPSLGTVRVIAVDEPAFPPDALRQSGQLQDLSATTGQAKADAVSAAERS